MPSPVTDTFQICTTQTIRMADFVRRSGRKTTQITDLSQSDPGMEVVEKCSKENSIWIFLFRTCLWKKRRTERKSRGFWTICTPKRMRVASSYQTSTPPVTGKQKLKWLGDTVQPPPPQPKRTASMITRWQPRVIIYVMSSMGHRSQG